MAARMNQDVVADQRKLNRGARADVAIPADPDIGADHGTGTDHRTRADFNAGPDHGKRIDDHVIFQTRRRMKYGRCRDAADTEPRLRTQGIGMKLARERHERAQRVRCAQDGYMRRNGRGKSLAHQTRPGAGLRKLRRRISDCRKMSDATAPLRRAKPVP